MELVDLPAFGRSVRLVWHKRRWRCPRSGCWAGTVTEQAREIAPPRERLTSRAGRWATRQAGCGRPVKDVASELGCSWHPVNASVRRWGQALIDADTARISDVFALGLDETLMWRRGRFRTKAWSTSTTSGVATRVRRTAKAPARWLLRRPHSWRAGIRAVLDLSGPYRAAFDTALPDAEQVADPFHVVKLANEALDEVRRRVQNQTLGHRGRKDDPLYRARKLLVSASERITDNGQPACAACSTPETPTARSATPGTPKRPSDPSMTSPAPRPAPPPAQLAAARTRHARRDQPARAHPRWRERLNWHAARVTNAPTEAANNLVKRDAPRSGSPTSTTTASEPCCMPGNWALLETAQNAKRHKRPAANIKSPKPWLLHALTARPGPTSTGFSAHRKKPQVRATAQLKRA